MINELEEFIRFSERKISSDPFGGRFEDGLVQPIDKVRQRAVVIEKILNAVFPEWKRRFQPGINDQAFEAQRQGALEAVAWLKEQERVAKLLGDTGPTLSASTFHPWVWGAAQTLWGSGHYRAAVSAAATSVSSYTQRKLEKRDKGEWDLITAAFAPGDPKEGHPKLRLCDSDGSQSFTSLHEGVGFFAKGVYKGIRNPASHKNLPELSETEALEQLAAFSLLARWIDEAEVVRAV